MAHDTERYVRSQGIDVAVADSLIITRDEHKIIRVTKVEQWSNSFLTFKVCVLRSFYPNKVFQ